MREPPGFGLTEEKRNNIKEKKDCKKRAKAAAVTQNFYRPNHRSSNKIANIEATTTDAC